MPRHSLRGSLRFIPQNEFLETSSREKIGIELPVSNWRTVYQFLQLYDKFTARNFARTERGEVRGIHLAIDHAELPAFQLPGQVRQRDLRGVAGMAEHGFAVEHASDTDAV